MRKLIVQFSTKDGFLAELIKDLAEVYGGKIIEDNVPSNFIPPYKITISSELLSNEGKRLLGFKESEL